MFAREHATRFPPQCSKPCPFFRETVFPHAPKSDSVACLVAFRSTLPRPNKKPSRQNKNKKKLASISNMKRKKKEQGASSETSTREVQEEDDADVERSSVSSEDDDDDDDDELVLAGQLMRNPDISSSSEENDEDSVEDKLEEDVHGDDDENKDAAVAPPKRRKVVDALSSVAHPSAKRTHNTKEHKAPAAASKPKKKKKRKNKEQEDLENVEFIFCDMEKDTFWNGCKALLMNSSTLYQRHASIWTDWLMEQVVGTVVTTEQDYAYYKNNNNAPQKRDNNDHPDNEDCAVFGFSSLLHLGELPSSTTTSASSSSSSSPSYQQEQQEQIHAAMHYIQQFALKECPTEYRSEMDQLLQCMKMPPNKRKSLVSDKTQPSDSAGKSDMFNQLYLFLHGRMVNLPLEIVLVLHQQLWLDWQWDQDDDDGNDKKTKTKQTKKQKRKPQEEEIVPTQQHSKEPRILRLAPCTKSQLQSNTTTQRKAKRSSRNNDDDNNASATTNNMLMTSTDLIYRYYDDELFASRALVQYTVKAPPSYSQEEALYLQVLVLTPERYQQAIQDLQHLVGG